MERAIFIILPKDNIGLRKEVNALRDLCESRLDMLPEVHINIGLVLMHTIIRSKFNRKVPVVLFYNISKFNFLASAVFRLFAVKTIQCYHEPGMENKLNYGFKRALKIFILEWLIGINRFITKTAVVFSDQAEEIFKSVSYRGDVYSIPLLPYFNFVESSFSFDRVYFLTFIGKIHPAKNFDHFLIMCELLDGLGLKTSILTPSLPEKYHAKIAALNHIDVVINSFIPDSKIERTMSESWFVYKMDSNMTQSGIVAQSRYFGCCCITSGIRGFQQEGETLSVLVLDQQELVEHSLDLMFERKELLNKSWATFIYDCKMNHLSVIGKWEKFFKGL